jgi:hypothetical protein
VMGLDGRECAAHRNEVFYGAGFRRIPRIQQLAFGVGASRDSSSAPTRSAAALPAAPPRGAPDQRGARQRSRLGGSPRVHALGTPSEGPPSSTRRPVDSELHLAGSAGWSLCAEGAFRAGSYHAGSRVGAPRGKQDAGQLLGEVPWPRGDVSLMGGLGALEELRDASRLPLSSGSGEAVAGMSATAG